MSQKPQPNPRPRRLNPCYRHPDIPTTGGFCAPCLRDRLSLLNPSSTEASTSSSSSSAFAALPELRRCKTFSAKNCDSAVGLSFEPRRRSCDVRSRSTLSNLFHLDDDGNGGDLGEPLKVESRNLGFLSKGKCPVSEVREEVEEAESDCEIVEARVSDLPNNVDEFEEYKTMKEFIDLECHGSSNKNSNSNRRDFKEIAGSFWVAASVFSKKLRKWKKKQGTRRDCGNGNADGSGVALGDMRLDRLRGRRLRDTQSEVGEYGFGRRSCDMDPRGSVDLGRASIDVDVLGRRSCDSDPRFSIDLGRASVDCGRISVDEAQCSHDAPRASWDGYLIGGGGGGGGGTLPRGRAPVVSVIENAMATVYGFDHRVLGEGKMKVENQMKDQYLEAAHLQRRRKSLDHCIFLKKDMSIEEDEEPKLLSNAKASPVFDRSKLLITEKELNDWRLNSLKDDSSESFETASKDLASVSSSSNGKVFKKCRQWSKLWSVWGLLNRKKGDKCGQEERLERGKEEFRHAGSAYNSRTNGWGPDPKLTRCHSASSSRGSSSVVGSSNGIMGRTESKSVFRRRKEDALERNRSARFSPNHLDNGLLRFYLTPLRSRRRSKPGKTRLKKSHSVARSVLRLY